ncbi:hypothetical protein AbraCBS73388_009883, partial [Aspergillus brasiliensis]
FGRTGFRYWRDPGAFAEYKLQGSLGKFVGVWSTMLQAPELAFATKSGTSAAASPFVVAIKLAKIEGLDHVVNACLLIFVISAATSGMRSPITLQPEN